tara:strand:+ start:1040 stop:1702 length:663 start_codon:yes stop_codon:yes gene_type:complete
VNISDTRKLRLDELEIAKIIDHGSRVLDVGCGDGALLKYLSKDKNVDGRGIELSQDGVNKCVAQGLSVIQGDADTDLKDYPENVFDYVILSRTLQATRKPKAVLLDLIRIGKRAIITLPNFGFFKIRWKLMTSGRMPETKLLSEPWYSTPNIHLCTILDFIQLCKELDLDIEKKIILDKNGKRNLTTNTTELLIGESFSSLFIANIFGEQGLFVLKNKII